MGVIVKLYIELTMYLSHSKTVGTLKESTLQIYLSSTSQNTNVVINKETYPAFIAEHYHIFVGDLSPEIETQTLREAFLPFGEIS